MGLNEFDSVKELLQLSDKGTLLEWAQSRIEESEKCMIVMGFPDGHGGLRLETRQIGFSYLYEICGFTDWVAETFANMDPEDIGLGENMDEDDA